jgi:hypothetical protein
MREIVPMRKWTVLGTAAIICSGAGLSQYDKLLTQMRHTQSESMQAELTDKLIALDPKRGDAYAARAVDKYFKKEYKAAIEDCSKALALNVKDRYWKTTALNYRYHSYIALNDLAHALPSCIQCLEFEHTPGVARDAAKLSRKAGKREDELKYSALVPQYAKEEQMETERTRQIIDNVNKVFPPR